MSKNSNPVAAKATNPVSPAVKPTAPVTGKPPVMPNPKKPNRLKAELYKKAEHVASFALTTITFILMVVITCAAHALLRDYVFPSFGVQPQDLLADCFKVAKYVALGIELTFWVYGVYKECKHHASNE